MIFWIMKTVRNWMISSHNQLLIIRGNLMLTKVITVPKMKMMTQLKILNLQNRKSYNLKSCNLKKKLPTKQFLTLTNFNQRKLNNQSLHSSNTTTYQTVKIFLSWLRLNGRTHWVNWRGSQINMLWIVNTIRKSYWGRRGHIRDSRCELSIPIKVKGSSLMLRTSLWNTTDREKAGMVFTLKTWWWSSTMVF
jgi:hypothetical protein